MNKAPLLQAVMGLFRYMLTQTPCSVKEALPTVTGSLCDDLFTLPMKTGLHKVCQNYHCDKRRKVVTMHAKRILQDTG